MDHKFKNLFKITRKIYLKKNIKLTYHNFTHILFVLKYSVKFSYNENANLKIIKPAALLHDMNYIINANSTVKAGNPISKKLLSKSGYSAKEIYEIIKVINCASSCFIRKIKKISIETKILSDADMAFKNLPITPVLYAHKYLAETGLTIQELATDIVNKQGNILKGDKLFFTKSAEDEFNNWAIHNVMLWVNIKNFLLKK